MKDIFDIIVIGSGPAGLSTSLTANELGLKVLVIDEQSQVGGQIYKSIGKNLDGKKNFLGKDYLKGQHLYKRFISSGIEHWLETSVWQITENQEVCFKRNGLTGIIKSKFIVICGGAYEKAMPITGWTLPGVMSVGAAQTLLKSSSVGADNCVFVGCGPLLYLTVYQYLKAGFKVKAVLDTSRLKQIIYSIPYFFPALINFNLLWQGLRWIRYISQHTKVYRRVKNISILGKEKAQGLEITLSNGDSLKIDTQNIFLHQGIVPNINLTMATGIKHHWSQFQYCWLPTLSFSGETSIKGIYVAGDNGGVGGVNTSITTGQIAALDIGKKLNKTTNFAKLFVWFKFLKDKSLRPFLDVLFQQDVNFLVPNNKNEIVCRCENVNKSEIENSIKLGISGPNQLKSYCRAGMGNCQGRLCGLTVQTMIALQQNRKLNEVGYYRLRPPVKPITLKELSSFEEYSPDEKQ